MTGLRVLRLIKNHKPSKKTGWIDGPDNDNNNSFKVWTCFISFYLYSNLCVDTLNVPTSTNEKM